MHGGCAAGMGCKHKVTSKVTSKNKKLCSWKSLLFALKFLI